MGLFLSPENEEAAIKAMTDVDYTTNCVSAAEQAIGRALSIETNAATPILQELLRRKLVEARPQYPAPNVLAPDPLPSLIPAKWFRTQSDAA